MKVLKILAVILVVLLLIVAWIAPVGPLPGFFLGGTMREAPAQWGDTSDVHEIRLKVPGTPPRVVIIWVIDFEGELHVVGSRDSGWGKGIGAASPVARRSISSRS